MLSVLVIDDDLALLNIIRLVLERSGEMSVRTARSSKEALEILSQNTFDALIMDYDLPEISGTGLLKILRGKGDVTPVIIFTGVGREQAAIDALNNGASFFLKKGENPQTQFLELEQMIQQAVDQRFQGKPLGTTRKILKDMVDFSLDPAFAIDRDGRAVAWNDAMAHLTNVPASAITGKGDYAYAEPFFGKRQKMLIDLVFSTEDEIRQHQYMIINQEKGGPVTAVTRAKKVDGTEWTLWMKAMPVFDNLGKFIAAVVIVRDVTTTFKDVTLQVPAADRAGAPGAQAAEVTKGTSGGLIDRILGRAETHYKEGVILFAREQNYQGAIAAFDRALEINSKLPYVWNDRGICHRTLGNYDDALKSFLRAVELAPENPEILFDMGETLEKMGVMQMDSKYLDAAVQMFKMVINTLPNNMEAWNHIGISLKEMGKAEESKFYFDRARDIKLWKKDTPVHRKRNEYL
jgi:DNA-binding response OmpR family regulator